MITAEDTRHLRLGPHDVPHGEYQYRKGFVAGFKAALGIVGRGSQAGFTVREVMGAANGHMVLLETWRETAPHATQPPKAPFQRITE